MAGTAKAYRSGGVRAVIGPFSRGARAEARAVGSARMVELFRPTCGGPVPQSLTGSGIKSLGR